MARATKHRSSKKAAHGSKKPPRKVLIGHATRAFTVLAAAPTVGVTVTRTSKGGAQVSAKLNTKYLVFLNDLAHAVVGTGQTNTIEWVVAGPPGSSYTIAVTEPASAHCRGGATLDDAGKDGGSCDFKT